MRAVVCGEQMSSVGTDAALKADFAKTGLIHLLIVSGAHLICLERVIQKLSQRFLSPRATSALIFSSFSFFVLMTGAAPPALRAYFGWCLKRVSNHYRLNWTRTQTLTASAFATLPFCSSRWEFSSLCLSWIAALGFGLANRRRRSRAQSETQTFTARCRTSLVLWRDEIWMSLWANAFVYAALIPALLPLGVPSWLSIICNLLFAPLTGFLLFPISLLGFTCRALALFADGMWSMVLWLIDHLAASVPDGWTAVSLSPLTLVPYICGLTVWLAERDRRAKLKARLTPPTFFTPLLFVACLWLGLPKASADPVHDELIVWNIGQGSWSTLKSPGLCQHFDMGGEWSPNAAIAASCARETNEVLYSHWDWDHIGLTKTALKLLPNLCVEAKPGGPAPTKFKAGLIDHLPPCDDSQTRAREIFLSRESPSALRKLHDANDFSRVFVEDRVIFPGDSPKKAEKIWRFSPLLKTARILIAGHHGSKSATSDELLERLPNVKMIVTSAHKCRYGHPHPLMLLRAQKFLLPVIRTEEWGTLHFDLGPPAPSRPSAATAAPQRRNAASGVMSVPNGISKAGTDGMSVPSSRRR